MPSRGELLIPESPVVDVGYDSPDDRSMEASSSRLTRNGTNYPVQPTPHFLATPSPSTLLPLLEEADRASHSSSGKGNDLRTAIVLRHALQYAVQHGDIELITWLAGLSGNWGEVLSSEVNDVEDDDGWGLVGMAIQSSCGRQDKEEIVRVIVARWGLQTGQREGKDRTGWTPLHLAALLSTPPLVSFLLTRGASPHSITNRGLTPADLVAGMENREEIAVLLSHATSTLEIQSTSALIPPANDITGRQANLQRRRVYATRQMEKAEKKEQKARQTREREIWVRERAKVVEVDPELLLPPKERPKSARSMDSALGWMADDDSGSETEDEDQDIHVNYQIHDRVNDSMLVFSLAQMPSIFDIIITTYQPVCFPVAKRAVPANALFLYSRFAYYRCDESWLEDFIESAVEKIEAGVYENVEDLAYLSFWAYNATLLLHLLRSDREICVVCEEMGLLSMVEELINAIHVFVIRVAERRIDSVLDASLLDYETLEDFDDVRFEGEWTLFRSFAGKKKRETILPPGTAGLSNGSSPARTSLEFGTSPPASAASLFTSLRKNVSSGSPFKSLGKPQSMQNLRDTPLMRTKSGDHESSLNPGMEVNSTDHSPRRVTDILSSVLLVLQLYEVNPAVVVQAFSQVFFWIACELFNRILTRKKYLCRTKAVQIRMNITTLEDWVRVNGLPAKTATKHLEPVAQLLQWLQCLSQIHDFDRLIGTMQNMKAINPLQMRRAVRDYRFEVNEGRMTDECVQYLAQLQKDWERRRVQMGVENMRAEAARRESGSETSTTEPMDESTPIDSLFEIPLADFTPQSAPECFGEFLDSRFMLPFLLPQNDDFLVATPAKDTAFLNALPSSPFLTDGLKMSRPPSRTSFSSSKPLAWTIPSAKKLRELPLEFFTWLKSEEVERRQGRVLNKAKREPVLPQLDPLGPSQRQNIPARPVVNTSLSDTKPSELLQPVAEDDDQTPLAPLQPYVSTSKRPDKPQTPTQSTTTPVQPPRRNLHTSASLEFLRQTSSPNSTSSPKPAQLKSSSDHDRFLDSSHSRSDSYELKIRNAVNSLHSPPSSTASLPSGMNASHYELARHRRDRQGSNASWSQNVVTSPDGSVSGTRPPSVIRPKSSSSDGQSSMRGSKQKWWKIGKKASSGQLRDDSRDWDRAVREGSEDTIVPGMGFENIRVDKTGGIGSPVGSASKRSTKTWGS